MHAGVAGGAGGAGGAGSAGGAGGAGAAEGAGPSHADAEPPASGLTVLYANPAEEPLPAGWEMRYDVYGRRLLLLTSLFAQHCSRGLHRHLYFYLPRLQT